MAPSSKFSLTACGALLLLMLAAPAAFASGITFASAADYDNNTVQTTGFFRDVLNGDLIVRGLDVGGTGNTALNFTGTDNNSPVLGRTTLYDTDPSTAAPTLFTGNLTASADILIGEFNNAKGAGILTLFTEGGTNTGLALFLTDNGNSDTVQIRLVEQTGTNTSNLSSVALGIGIAEDLWYRLLLTLTLSGSNFTLTGQVFSHTIGTDPNSLLGAQIGTTLTYNGVLGSGLSNPYEVGLVARGVSAVVNTSVTNFDINGSNNSTPAVPEPGTLLLLGIGFLGLARQVRRRLTK